MGSIEDIANELVDSDFPILLLDTCAILDIVRCTTSLLHNDNLESALYIASNISEFSLVKSSLIEKEFEDNVESTTKEFNKNIKRLDSEISCLDIVARHFCIAEVNKTISSDISEKLVSLARGIISKSKTITCSDELRARASNRVINCVAPAKKGKDSLKDCLIFEEYLELSRLLKERDSNKIVVFLTSNTSEYKKESIIHSDISDAVDNVNLKVCFSWHHAKQELYKHKNNTKYINN